MFINFENDKKISVYNGKFWGTDISKYGLENNRVDYRAMVEAFTDGAYILNNNIINAADDYEIYCGVDYDEETDTYSNIYQWYIIPENAADYFAEYTDEIVYYSELLDIYLLAVTHYGTSWDYVLTSYEIK